MLMYTTALEDSFVDFFSNLQHTNNIGHNLLKRFEAIELNVECTTFDKSYLLRLFTCMRIYYCLKFENQNLGKIKKRKNRTLIKVAHL